MAYPSSLTSLPLGYSPWDDTSMLLNTASGGMMLSEDEHNLHGLEGMRKCFCVISNVFVNVIAFLS